MSKKYALLIVFLTLIMNYSICLGLDNTFQTLTNLEKSYFNTSFPNESYNKRLERLEIDIFSKVYNDSVDQRIKRIQKNINTSPNTGQIPGFTFQEPPINDSATDYPAVTALEKKLFRTSYANDNIYNRLARLEQSSFGRVFNNDNLFDRVERLTADEKSDFTYEQDDYSTQNTEKTNAQNKLSELEYNFLNKTYENETDYKRLARLEKTILGAVQSGSTSQRIDKLAYALQNRPMNDPTGMMKRFYDDNYQNSYHSNQTAAVKNIFKNFFSSGSNSSLSDEFFDDYENENIPNYYQSESRTYTKYPGLPPVETYSREKQKFGAGAGVKILPY